MKQSLDLVALSIESGRLCTPSFSLLHDRSESLLGRAVWTHEFADPDVWFELRVALAKEVLA